MNQIDMVEALKKAAKASPPFDAVMHVFALRERARFNVTIDSLYETMKREGFLYDKGSELTPVLKTLANLGFGRLDLGSNGRVRALTDLRYSLQSMGQAACGGASSISAYRQRRRFKTLQKTPEAIKPLAQVHPLRRASDRVMANPGASRLVLTVLIGDKPINVEMPKALSPQEIATLVTRLSAV